MRRIIAAALALSFAACTQRNERDTTNNESNVAPRAVVPEGQNVSLPDDRTPLAEPKRPIDPKSAEAAGQVVQHYGALIEERRPVEAKALWGNTDAAADFAVQLKRYPEAHLEIGKPGDLEGAAGSIYVTVPVVFYGKDQNDAHFRRSADVILRRVNEVPGSTEAQRRWHIERIEWR